jgi:hypothetical protein
VHPFGRFVAPALVASALGVAAPARADVSSWLYFGGGPSWLTTPDRGTQAYPSLQMETGLGTPPADALAAGGLLRLHTHFERGTDLALLARVATHGFVNGGWGAGLDVGGYQRWWEQGSTGLLGSLVLGAPWGITLSATAGFGTNDQRLYTGTLGVDLARLTVYRRTGETWFKNPFPAYRPEERRDLRE